MKIHIVQKGDTLWKIAKKYGVNFEELKKMNTQLSNPDMIMPGMKIKVPTSGGSIKKEAPIAGISDANIKMGAKEMPLKEKPFAKEKPKEMPIKEEPIEEPIMEAPKPEPPKVAAPKEEVPKKPYVPKKPKPIIPEIDVNNYYLMNMANLNVQQPHPKPQPKAEIKPEVKPMPELPPKPKNILPNIKPFENEEMDESSEEMPINQGGFKQPMYPYHQHMYPASPMPSANYGLPGGYTSPYGAPYPQVQGTMTGPMPYGGLPGVQGAGYMPTQQPYYDDESSSFMPQMPLAPNTSPMMSEPNQPHGVMGAQDYQDAQMPHMPNMPMMAPSTVAPAMHAQYPYPPYPAPLYPASPILPGPGLVPAYTQPFQGYPVMPQVQGVAEGFESPEMYGNMPHQMPLAPNLPHNALQGTGMMDDCGCGHQTMVGTYGPEPAGYGPMGYGAGAGPVEYGPGVGPMGYQPGAGPVEYGPGAGPMGYQPGAGPMGYQPGAGPVGYGPGVGPMGYQPGAGPVGYGPGAGPMGYEPGVGPMGYEPGVGPAGFEPGAASAAGYGAGFAPEGFGAPGAVPPGTAPVYTPPYGQQFASPPYMNPYGPVSGGFGLTRNDSGKEDED